MEWYFVTRCLFFFFDRCSLKFCCALLSAPYPWSTWGCDLCDSNAVSCGCDFLAERIGNGGRIPKIIYPKNNSIEVELGESSLKLLTSPRADFLTTRGNLVHLQGQVSLTTHPNLVHLLSSKNEHTSCTLLASSLGCGWAHLKSHPNKTKSATAWGKCWY